MRAAAALAASLATLVPFPTRGEPFEIAALRALRQDERHGQALILTWLRSSDSAFGIEWAEYAEAGRMARRDLVLRWSAINPEPLWRPSFEVGLGRATGADRMPAWVAVVGVGGRWALIEDGLGLRLAAEIRYRREERRLPGEEGLVALIGLALPFGEGSETHSR
jgi:hypothetical protein